jgi:hypothetical protein
VTEVAATLPVVCQIGATFPVLVSGQVLVVVGRCYGSASYRADADSKELIYASLGGVTFTEKGSSMYDDYDVTGITGAFPDGIGSSV